MLQIHSVTVMTYLFRSPMKTVNLFICIWLIDIKSVRIISYDFIFVLRVMVVHQQIIPSYLAAI
jgi:hypothetical protein